MTETPKKKIHNSFFDLVSLALSIVWNAARSIGLLFSDRPIKKDNRFFLLLDFIFRKWPVYFWKKPTLYKLCNFFPDLIHHTFPSVNTRTTTPETTP